MAVPFEPSQILEPGTLAATLLDAVPNSLTSTGTVITRFFGDFRVLEQFYFCSSFVVRFSDVTWRLMSRSLLLPQYDGIMGKFPV
ncbi:MAG: hypothetical protein CLLPBCKN_006410 [Chroococcidiopsis cubana SAG 39.79]|uniref:hypothetical protein n=1 Tax=Chroococcidiopsis cubana TaxID=171392 RepID=UPI000D04835B|nr:hypothetical protein [Chroococcidiopsis cubana]MDZ4876975.1 hypothetical protein [Chroococcidiopsis cubana SAG 39.79]